MHDTERQILHTLLGYRVVLLRRCDAGCRFVCEMFLNVASLFTTFVVSLSESDDKLVNK